MYIVSWKDVLDPSLTNHQPFIATIDAARKLAIDKSKGGRLSTTTPGSLEQLAAGEKIEWYFDGEPVTAQDWADIYAEIRKYNEEHKDWRQYDRFVGSQTVMEAIRERRRLRLLKDS